jgi:hypothetical protein
MARGGGINFASNKRSGQTCLILRSQFCSDLVIFKHLGLNSSYFAGFDYVKSANRNSLLNAF